MFKINPFKAAFEAVALLPKVKLWFLVLHVPFFIFGISFNSTNNGTLLLGSVVIFYFIHWIAAAKCRNDSNRCLSFSNLENNLL